MEIKTPLITINMSNPATAVVAVVGMLTIVGYSIYKHIEGKEKRGEDITVKGFMGS